MRSGAAAGASVSISGQLGPFLAVAAGYVLLAFAWGWYKRHAEPVDGTDEDPPNEGRNGGEVDLRGEQP